MCTYMRMEILTTAPGSGLPCDECHQPITTSQVECRAGSGQMMNLRDVAHELSRRLLGLFVPDRGGRRPAHGGEARYATDPAFRELVLFYEFFDGDTGQGLGASHQTGWTALAIEALRDVIDQRREASRKRG